MRSGTLCKKREPIPIPPSFKNKAWFHSFERQALSSLSISYPQAGWPYCKLPMGLITESPIRIRHEVLIDIVPEILHNKTVLGQIVIERRKHLATARQLPVVFWFTGQSKCGHRFGTGVY